MFTGYVNFLKSFIKIANRKKMTATRVLLSGLLFAVLWSCKQKQEPAAETESLMTQLFGAKLIQCSDRFPIILGYKVNSDGLVELKETTYQRWEFYPGSDGYRLKTGALTNEFEGILSNIDVGPKNSLNLIFDPPMRIITSFHGGSTVDIAGAEFPHSSINVSKIQLEPGKLRFSSPKFDSKKLNDINISNCRFENILNLCATLGKRCDSAKVKQWLNGQ